MGVSPGELQAIVRSRFEEYLRGDPELQARIEKDPDYDPNSISMIYSCELALEALASLPDGAGAAAYVERLDALHKERGWALPGWRRPDA